MPLLILAFVIAVTAAAPAGIIAMLLVLICSVPFSIGLLFVFGRRLYRTLSARHGERRRPRTVADAEQRARALMSELCPNGWRAQITVFEREEELPEEAPSGRCATVALDWAELGDTPGQVAVMRRLWASSIPEALDAMVADRQTDETLEQIERSAGVDAGLWPDR